MIANQEFFPNFHCYLPKISSHLDLTLGQNDCLWQTWGVGGRRPHWKKPYDNWSHALSSATFTLISPQQILLNQVPCWTHEENISAFPYMSTYLGCGAAVSFGSEETVNWAAKDSERPSILICTIKNEVLLLNWTQNSTGNAERAKSFYTCKLRAHNLPALICGVSTKRVSSWT